MLCLQSWCGALPPRLERYSQKLQVFSKLGGNFLGFVAKPCAESLHDATTAYITLRGMQAQAAMLLKHDYLPSRYLALYVGSCRITYPSFPFKDCLDQNQLGVLGALHGAERIDVVYDGDTDFGVAKASLRAKGLLVYENDIKVVVQRDGMCFVHTPINVLVQPELDVWAFNKNIQHLVFWWPARTIGDLRLFPDLTSLSMMGLCSVQHVDFGNLASSCKSLQTLDIRLEVDPSNLLGINKLCSLEHLGVVACGSGKATIPREVGSLSKLTSLTVQGQQITGQIPTEIGQLGGLRHLRLKNTKLTSCIPSEFGNLVRLSELDLSENEFLHGELPRQLNKLSNLKHIYLNSTPSVTTHFFELQGAWKNEMWTKNTF